MAIKDIKNLKEKFSDGIEPHGSDFGDIFDSFFHKSTKLPRTQILGLNKTLDSKADKKELDNIAAGMIYKPPVPTVAALTTTYPVAKKCWAVKVTADGFIYQFDGEIWNNTGLTAFPEDVVRRNDLTPLQIATDMSVGYGWKLSQSGSYLKKEGVTFPNLTDGAEYRLILKVPDDITTNQMLVNIDKFYITILDKRMHVYHKANGSQSVSTPIGVLEKYIGKKIEFSLSFSMSSQGTLVGAIYINGEVQSGSHTFTTLDIANPATLYLGSYQGYTLYTGATIYKFVISTPDEVSQVVDYNNPPDEIVGAVTVLYDNPINKQSQSGVVLDGVSSYIDIQKNGVIAGGDAEETYLMDITFPDEPPVNSILLTGKIGSLGFQLVDNRLFLGRTGYTQMYEANIGSYYGSRCNFAVVRKPDSYEVYINGNQIPLTTRGGYVPMDESPYIHIGGLASQFNVGGKIHAFLKLDRALSAAEINENLSDLDSIPKASVVLSNSKIGAGQWQDTTGEAVVSLTNCVCENPNYIYSGKREAQVKYLNSLPDELYLVTGEECNIYWGNVIPFFDGKYSVELSIGGSYARSMDRSLRLNFPNVGTFTGMLNLFDSDGHIIESKELKIIVTDINAGSGVKQILFSGDSTIDDALMIDGQPYYGHEGSQIVRMVYDECNASKGFTPLMIGHKQDYKPYNHAGMSGWSSSGFLNSNSPFWIDGKIDFKKYVQNNIATIHGATDRVDFFVYQIGINDLKNNNTSAEVVINNIKTLIEYLHRDYPDAKVIVGFPAGGCDANGYSVHFFGNSSYQKFTASIRKLHRLLIAEFDKGAYSDKVFICNAGQWIDRVYGYPHKLTDVSARNTEQILERWDSVHPNESGYNQMADAYVARVKALI